MNMGSVDYEEFQALANAQQNFDFTQVIPEGAKIKLNVNVILFLVANVL